MFPGGELEPDESKGGGKEKTSLKLAAVRVASLDVGQSCPDMPETDFASIGGKKERLPPGLLSMKT